VSWISAQTNTLIYVLLCNGRTIASELAS